MSSFSSRAAKRRLLAGAAISGLIAGAVACAPASALAQTKGSAPSQAGQVTWLPELVVTAQKKTENSLNVPLALTVLEGKTLVQTHSLRFEDYVANVPGLQLINGGSTSELIIRGVSTGASSVNPSTSIYVDETPYTSQGPFAAAVGMAPNLDPFDMQRIEVLKGPQGTLYGATGAGGVVKFITNAPDPKRLSAEVQAGVSSVSNGGTGSDVHAMVNLPLSTNAALRLVGYDDFNPGFIDDPSRGKTKVNSSRTRGGRASFLYEPTDNFSIRLNALYQKYSAADVSYVDVDPGSEKPTYGSWTEANSIAQPNFSTNQVYNVTINLDLGPANLVSASSYYTREIGQAIDLTRVYGPTLSFFLAGDYGGAETQNLRVHGFSQEVRLTSTDKGPLHWQVGAFYSDEGSSATQHIYPVALATNSIIYDFPLDLETVADSTSYREYSAFGDIDYDLTPTFQVGVGARYGTNSQKFRINGAGLFVPGGLTLNETSSEDVFNYSADARWHATPGTMVYARIASGYQPGGPNDVTPGVGLEPSYKSAKTVNYEVGVKSSLLDHRLTAEIAAYHIDWSHVQLVALIEAQSAIINGGTARSDGVEWNFNYVPVAGLTLGFNGAYDDAHLTQSTPASVGGVSGDRLPSAPRWQTSASVEYDRPVSDQYTGFAGANWRFTGERYADFVDIVDGQGPRQIVPSNSIVDLDVGLRSNRWTATLYVKNVGNVFAINYLSAITALGGGGQQAAYALTPRTIGATLTARF